MAVTRIARFSLTATNADLLAAFYCQAFGFEQILTEQHRDAGFARLMGLEPTQARAQLLRLGQQTLELIAFTPAGMAYSPDIGSNDPRFQHLAIVVADMAAAYDRLRQCGGWSPITRPEPQRLPESSGAVTAFKFRDPEGHPLELLAFPAARRPSAWRGAQPGGPCLGIDHSAITVASSARSIDFYRLLGWSVAGQTRNRGCEQERLDQVPGAIVEVTALRPLSSQPPHLELLCYQAGTRPASGAGPALCSNDVAATRLVLEADDLHALMPILDAAGVRCLSSGMVPLPQGGRAALVRDPDGHALLLCEPQHDARADPPPSRAARGSIN